MAETCEENQHTLTFSSQDLKDLKRDLLATVYNQTHTQLLIYQQGLWLRTHQIIKSRRTSQNASITDIEEPMPPVEVLNDIKLDKELDALRNIFKVAYDELCRDDVDTTENPNSNLKNVIEALKESNNEVELLTKEVQQNKMLLKHLKEQEKMEQEQSIKKLQQQSERLAELRDQLSNIKRINQLEFRLVEKWEKNRIGQAIIVGEKEERCVMQELLELHRRLAGEQRLICEIQSFRNNEIRELQDNLKQWEQKSKEEQAKITTKNLILTQNIADVVKSYEKHQEIMKQRQEFVKEYLKQKAEEQRLYEEQRYRIECAVRIQAWWRGVMVRRGLGPYRKKSKKGKKAKAKK